MIVRYCLLLTAALLVLTSCKKSVSENAPETADTAETTSSPTTKAAAENAPSQTERSVPTLTAREAVPIKAEEVIQTLKSRNFKRLAQYVHPEMGLRFSPEVYVDPGHKVFSAEVIPKLMQDETVYVWGSEDGSGKTIKTTFPQYFERYVYDVDFAATDSIFYNQTLQHGNAINNVPKAFPGCIVVEYYLHEVDPKLQGLDWRALRMVFEPYQNDWYLVGLVHAAWTP